MITVPKKNQNKNVFQNDDNSAKKKFKKIQNKKVLDNNHNFKNAIPH